MRYSILITIPCPAPTRGVREGACGARENQASMRFFVTKTITAAATSTPPRI